MAAKKASKQAAPRKSVRSAPPKRTRKRVSTKRAAPGFLSKAKKVVEAVVVGAAAAAGAVQGVVEVGKKMTGLGQESEQGSKPPQSKSRKRSSRR
jgi:hypothetical protein